MATQAYPYAVLTDGTTTITFADGAGGTTNWGMVRATWAPAVAGRRRSLLGGAGVYEDVVEGFRVNVRGSTAAAAMANLAALVALLQQAERWARGEDVAAVLFKYAPQGSEVASTSNPFRAVVRGPVGSSGAAGGVALPVTFADVGMLYEISDVSVSFIRAGLWTLDAESAVLAASGVQPNKATTTFASAATIESPVRVRVSGFGHDSADQASSTLLLAERAADIQFVEGEGGSPQGGASYSVVADSANRARGGSVGRLTPAAADTEYTVAYLIGGGNLTRERADVWACVRSNVARSWRIRAETRDPEGRSNGYGPVRETAAVTTPQIVYLGSIYSARKDHAAVWLTMSIASLSGSPTLDVDYVVALGMHDTTNRAISLLVDGTVDTVDYLEVTPRHETHPAPHAAAVDTAVLNTSYPLGRMGDAYLATRGTTLTAVWLATRSNYWTWTVAAGTVPSLTVSATRYVGYLAPQ